jgi:negative regulator of flagellin synthesis FlgM
MKINPNRIDQSIASGLGKQDRVSKSENGDADVGAKKVSQGMIDSSARINISEKAKEMARVKELAKQAPDVDAEKVAKFRAMIEKGEYKVNAEALADRMLQDELALAATQES